MPGQLVHLTWICGECMDKALARGLFLLRESDRVIFLPPTTERFVKGDQIRLHCGPTLGE